MASTPPRPSLETGFIHRSVQHEGQTPGALQGDDYPLTYEEDGYPELPACLDRRKPKMTAKAA